jgi:hypothetical protein
MTLQAQTEKVPPACQALPPQDKAPFGVNEVRLNGRQWLVTMVILAALMWLVPTLWQKVELFDTPPDYRIPYELSKDYWVYGRRLHKINDARKVILLGDSVIWGEYVLPDGTLSHFLNQQAGTPDRFVNAGLNGLFPLAQQGLVRCYARSLHHRKVILQWNALWMTSPKADLSTDKEEQFNHSRLVPQFSPRIPCYKAGANERLSAVIENHVDFISWVGHLQNAYFGQRSILSWTLQDDGGEPARYPNSYRNPLDQITFKVPLAPDPDPQRGPLSPRHRPWTVAGQGTTSFDWVPAENSLQWWGFRETVKALRARDNDVLTIVGPFNEHTMAETNRTTYLQLRDHVISWLNQNQIPFVAPEVLPSELYADASHPLTEGYKLLSQRLYADREFRTWLGN